MVATCGINRHSISKTTLDDIIEQLKQQVGSELAVDYYPEKPATYRLNHANGALLVNYARSKYGNRQDIGLVTKERDMTFTITIVSRNLHDRYGAVLLVDWVIEMLSGFTPTHCDKPLAPTADYFIQHTSGLWFYGVDMDTQAVHIQTLPMTEI